MLNKPHALYYNGELIAIITNPDPFGKAAEIAEALCPDEWMVEARPIPYNMGNIDKWGNFAKSIIALGVEEITMD